LIALKLVTVQFYLLNWSKMENRLTLSKCRAQKFLPISTLLFWYGPDKLAMS